MILNDADALLLLQYNCHSHIVDKLIMRHKYLVRLRLYPLSSARIRSVACRSELRNRICFYGSALASHEGLAILTVSRDK